MSKKKLTVHQRLFIKEYIRNGGNATQAELKANKSHKTYNAAAVTADQTLKNLNVQERIKAVQEKLGITDEMLARVLDNGLKAKDTKIGVFRGRIIQEKSYEDRPTQLKALEIAHKLRGDLIDKHEITGTLNIREALKKDLEKRKQLNKK